MYLYREVLKDCKIVSSEDSHHIYCDGHNHYHLFPNMDVEPKEGCWCKAVASVARGPLTLNHQKLARPRYEVYNKDPDFFHDHINGGMIWLKQSNRPDTGETYWIEQLVEQILNLLNREEHATILRL